MDWRVFQPFFRASTSNRLRFAFTLSSMTRASREFRFVANFDVSMFPRFDDADCYYHQLREANPAKARWEAPDIILEEKLTPTGHHMLEPGGASDAASADSKIRVEYETALFSSQCIASDFDEL